MTTAPLRVFGFTGTRNPPTREQLDWLAAQFSGTFEFHHGACVGSDEAAHGLAKAEQARIIVHPPADEKLMMPRDHDPAVIWLPAKSYHARNRDIVHAADIMFALPDGPARPHSGTWYTINYARSNRVPVSVCFPDGTWKGFEPGDLPR